MRIIGGRHKGHPLVAPAGRTTRPTSARAREGVFNILMHGDLMHGHQADDPDGDRIPNLRDVHVLEAFAGTGAFAFEALSRGAGRATLLDLDSAALEAARRNARQLGETSTVILRMDATRPRLAREAHGLVFLDPPWGTLLAARAMAALAAKGWIAPEALVIAEIGAEERLVPPQGFTLLRERRFGAARFLFFRFSGGAGSGATD